MSPTEKKKRKTKRTLDDAMFKFNEKKEELDDLLEDETEDDQRLLAATLNELSDKWEIVINAYVDFKKLRQDDEAKETVLKEHNTKLHFLEKCFMDRKLQVAKTLEKYANPVSPVNQEIVEVRPEDLIDDEIHAMDLTQQSISEEVTTIELQTANLPASLSRELIFDQRVDPDRLSANMEIRLQPHFQKLISLKPERKELLQQNH